MAQPIDDLHAEACRTGQMSYLDPDTGYLVFTELYHRRRGYCCDSGCRHCPFKKNIAPAEPDLNKSKE